MCWLASLLGLLLLQLPVVTSIHNSVPQSAKTNIGKSRKGGYVGGRPRRRKSGRVNEVDALRSDSSDEFDANGLAKAANDVMNLYVSTRDISVVNQTVADWPGIRILSAETPSELFAIEYTSRIGSVAFYSVYEVEVEGSTQLHWSPSTILPASCYSCLGVTLHSSSQRDITDFAEELIFRLRETKETFGEPPPTTQALEDAVKRVARLVRRPEHVLVTDQYETILDYPNFVREAAIALCVTNSTGILERIDVPDDVSIHIRANSSDDSAGSWCIFVQEGGDGRIMEYYLRLCDTSFDFPGTIIRRVERDIFPIQWKRILSANFRPSLRLSFGMIFSYFCDIPNFGFGKFADCRVTTFVKVALAIEAMLVIFGIALAKNRARVISHNDNDMDWLERKSRAMRSVMRSNISSWGNGRPGPLKLGVAFLLNFAIPAVSEELIFRGFLQTLLLRYMSNGRAITIQALPFGLWHYGYGSKQYMAVCAAIGLWWGCLFAEAGNLLLLALIHFARNSSASFLGAKETRPLLQYELSQLYELDANTNEEQEDTDKK